MELIVEFLSEYGLFLAKVITVVISILVVIGSIVAAGAKGRKLVHKGHIEVKNLNEQFSTMTDLLKEAVLDKHDLKLEHKAEKKKLKEEEKAKKKADKKGEQQDYKKRVYVLDFDGDIKASAVESLKHEITAVLSMAETKDEIVVRLESGGGMVHSYGLASSQLARIKNAGIPLTITVDRVAASGGYMMACIADKLVAAPFAILGSIGVVAQVPNFHRLLKDNKIDFEMHTAGEFKRTLTMFGENTDKARHKFQEDMEDTHELFKEFVAEYRPKLDVANVATGEVWFGRRAISKDLVDELITSDEYLSAEAANADIYEVGYIEKKTLSEKMGMSLQQTIDAVILKWWNRLQSSQYFR